MNKYFTYCPIDGFTTHPTEEAAKESAKDSLELERESSADYGWSETSEVCWGKISEQVVVRKTGEVIMYEGEMVEEWGAELEKP